MSTAQLHVDINIIPLGSAVLARLDINKGFINDYYIRMILMSHGSDTIRWIDHLEEHLSICQTVRLVLKLLFQSSLI